MFLYPEIKIELVKFPAQVSGHVMFGYYFEIPDIINKCKELLNTLDVKDLEGKVFKLKSMRILMNKDLKKTLYMYMHDGKFYIGTYLHKIWKPKLNY